MTTNNPLDQKLESIRAELETMTPDQQLEELVTWRVAAPLIQKVTNQLAEFKTYAKNADELAEKIRALTARYEAMIQFREEQLAELVKVVESCQSDPVGASKHIENMAKLSLKRKLN